MSGLQMIMNLRITIGASLKTFCLSVKFNYEPVKRVNPEERDRQHEKRNDEKIDGTAERQSG